MTISILDGSNYFKGLLLLIRQDRKLSESEKRLMKKIGKVLGFEREFCENAIHEILDNRHISDELPEFSSKELCRKFISDGLAIAYSDVEVHPAEEEWLRAAAKKYKVGMDWFESELERAAERMHLPAKLEVEDLRVCHH